MLMKDFIKRVRGQIDKLKDYDDSVLTPSELLEAQSHIEYLRKLLNEYADSDVLITKANVAECTQPFLSFLAQRWLRIAKTDTTYAKAPKTQANQCCKFLAEQLMMVDQQVDYKPREINQYLIPPIKVTMTSFIDYALTEIETFVKENPGNVDHYVYFEAVYALNRLKKILEVMPKSTDLVTKESLEPIFQLMRERYDLIHGTDADYSINPQTAVNNIYTHLARLMQLTLELNDKPHASIDANHFLMPNIRVERRQTSLQTRLLAKLSEQSNDETGNDFFAALISQKTTTATFAARMKAVLAKLEKDDSKDMPLLAYLESRSAIRCFNEIVNEHANIDQPLTKTQLEAYINFLSNRWNEIDGTLASYSAAPQLHTRAQGLCHQLVSHIVLAAVELGHQNRDPEYLLMRTPHNIESEITANNNLRLNLTAEYKTFNELVAEMLNLPQDKWREFINLFDRDRMVTLLSNGKPLIDDALKTDFKFDNNEARSRALLLCLFLTYDKTRREVASDRLAYGTSVISIFTNKIPTLKQKTDAVDVVCDRLLSGASIVEIANSLNDAQSPLFPHRAALQDKRLKGCWDQLELAARQLPAPEVSPSVKLLA